MLYLLYRESADVGWDEFDAKVVRATSEHEARHIANENTGDEGGIWHNVDLVKCKQIDAVGTPKEILGSFNAG